MPMLPWVLIGVGFAAIAAAFVVAAQGGRRTLLIVGMTNAALGVTLMLANGDSTWRIPAVGLFTAALLAASLTVGRDNWRAARLEMTLAAGTIVALVLLGVFYATAGPTTQKTLLVVVGALATAFVVSSLFRGFHAIDQHRQR